MGSLSPYPRGLLAYSCGLLIHHGSGKPLLLVMFGSVAVVLVSSMVTPQILFDISKGIGFDLH